MSHLKGGINLMQFAGAELRSMEINGKLQNVVVIPVAYNNINVTCHKETGTLNGAYINVRGWMTNEKFRNACMERNASIQGYEPPSHQLSLSFTEEFTNAAFAAAERRLRATESFMKDKPTDEDIAKAARIEVKNKLRIGTLTPLESSPAPTYTGSAPSATTGGYVASPGGDGGSVVPSDLDDLPF